MVWCSCRLHLGNSINIVEYLKTWARLTVPCKIYEARIQMQTPEHEFVRNVTSLHGLCIAPNCTKAPAKNNLFVNRPRLTRTSWKGETKAVKNRAARHIQVNLNGVINCISRFIALQLQLNWDGKWKVQSSHIINSNNAVYFPLSDQRATSLAIEIKGRLFHNENSSNLN